MAAKDWPHPISPREGYDLLLRYVERHSRRTAVAAALLGVNPRTLARWLAEKRVPQHVGALLDQLLNGPVFPFALWRGATARQPWRDYMQRWMAEDARNAGARSTGHRSQLRRGLAGKCRLKGPRSG